MSVRLRSFALALLAIPAVVPAQSAPPSVHVAQFGMDPQHTGRSPYRGPHSTPEISWRVRARNRVYASPVLSSEGYVVFAGIDGMVHALDREGIERWAFAAPHEVFATPAVWGSTVLLAHGGARGGGGAALVALEGRGRALWSQAMPEDLDASPTVGPDGTLYLAARGVTALRPDGTVRWRASTAGHVLGAPALSRDGATVYVADLSGELAFVRARDGEVERRVRVGAAVYGAPLVIEDGAIVVGARDGHVRAFGPDGAVRWDFATRDEIRSSPALGLDGTVIVGSDDGGIYGVRASDGTQAWRVATSGRVRASARIDADGYVFIGSEDDVLYALDPRGAVAWTVTLGADIDSSALLLPWGGLAVGCDDGGLYHLAAR
jgi:outer membrane protein assembly factor BamB